MTSPAQADVVEVLQTFGGDPQRASDLASFLGFDPIASPQDQLAGVLSGGLKRFLLGTGDRDFGVDQLYRVGRAQAHPAEAGLWVCVLKDWGFHPSDRDRARRRVVRAMVEQVSDARSLVLLVPHSRFPRREAELVLPRTQGGSSANAATSVRAHIELDNPTRFHRDLLRELRVQPGSSLLDVSTRWQRHFSIERVTTDFYREYEAVRNRMADALLSANPDHPGVLELQGEERKKERRAWSTRQMGRVLFLWFLQAKRWLGEAGGNGSPTYLLDLWNNRWGTADGEFYRGLLHPLFFDAMATGSSSNGENDLLGVIPYLNGGLFRTNALEDRLEEFGPVSLPDEIFDPKGEGTLLGLLSRYRFTTRESTPDDQSVDPDPELLGRVFENLYQGDERHDSGTYYTPREIVHFMCREALDGYLRDTAGVSQETLNALRAEASGSHDEPQSVSGVPVKKLVNALETVRVCDPAVGSGAFLLGALQEIVTLRRGILFSQRRHVDPATLYQTVSEWKRNTIEHSLYGVDINPEAVEICQLRLWLSMVLDMEVPPQPNENWSLPNLDFRIVAGDSLIDRVAGITFKEAWPPPSGLQLDMELQDSLARLERSIAHRKQQFQSTHRRPERLRELRGLVAEDQREVVLLHLRDSLIKAKDALTAAQQNERPKDVAIRQLNAQVNRVQKVLEQVETKDFALVQKPFLWPIAFPEVLREGDPRAGFDIVLANPPYVRQERLDAEDQLAYGRAFPEVYSGMADILVYFYARALQILRPGGWLSFITSNKFMRAGYGDGIREHLPASLLVQRVTDFGDLPLFEANGKAIAAYPAVLVGSRLDGVVEHGLKAADLAGPVRKELANSNSKVNPESVRGVLEDLDRLLARAEISDFPQIMLKKDGWVLEEPAMVRLFERLMKQGTPLNEFVQGRINYGIKTGLNRAFEIDQAKRRDLVEDDPHSADLIKPWLRGRDIKRWKAPDTGNFVLHVPWSVDISMYPAVEQHLLWFKGELSDRAEAKRGVFPWFAMSRWGAEYHEQFARPKIIFGHFINSATFAYDTSGSYLNNACSFAVSPSPSLAAIVNSNVGWWLLSHLCTPLQNGYIQLFVQFLERLPIVQPSGALERDLSELVEAGAIGAPVDEENLNSLVYDLYGLSPKEVRRVEDWFERRSLRPETDIEPEASDD